MFSRGSGGRSLPSSPTRCTVGIFIPLFRGLQASPNRVTLEEKRQTPILGLRDHVRFRLGSPELARRVKCRAIIMVAIVDFLFNVSYTYCNGSGSPSTFAVPTSVSFSDIRHDLGIMKCFLQTRRIVNKARLSQSPSRRCTFYECSAWCVHCRA